MNLAWFILIVPVNGWVPLRVAPLHVAPKHQQCRTIIRRNTNAYSFTCCTSAFHCKGDADGYDGDGDDGDAGNENESKMGTGNGYVYKKPVFSESFRKHMEEVTDGFAANDDEGVDCTGEPSMDPSRMVMDDGLDSEYLSDFN